MPGITACVPFGENRPAQFSRRQLIRWSLMGAASAMCQVLDAQEPDVRWHEVTAGE